MTADRRESSHDRLAQPRLHAALLLLAVAAGPAAAQCTVDWTQPSNVGPTQRSYPGAAYDSARSRVVLYGGINSSTLRTDVWAWDGTLWTQLLASGGAGGRRGMSMAYDAPHDRMVIFGGASATGINGETWEFDGSAWIQRFPSGPVPSARSWHALAYDAAHGVTVLFGGWSGGLVYSAETWTWDGTSWTLASSTGPAARAFHSMAFDSARGKIVLFGGLLNSSSGSTYYGDTWEWDGTAWTQAFPAVSPPARGYNMLAYDSTHGKTVLFGGFEILAGAFADTWEWDGASWLQRPTGVTPAARQSSAMAYDAARDRVLVFGGQVGGSTAKDTWTVQLPCPADFNCDTFVDGIDYDQFNNAFENPDPAQQLAADFNGDGFVDGIDYDQFNIHFEAGC